MDPEHLARVELTSEDEAHPVESALVVETGLGWRASAPGEQVVRLLFDEPLSLRRIQLQFRETEQERTQEFVLSWSGDGGQTYREVVRQQYHFSPRPRPGSSKSIASSLTESTPSRSGLFLTSAGGGPRIAGAAAARLTA